ncbi:MAG: Arc family DNA-binding protein [Chloroflexi bacterium]|nr:MAG: Arc family DNA-binding protein [Chloroflexota bacterium]
MEKNTAKHARMSVYLPSQVQAALKQEATRQHRSMNAQLVWCLEQCLPPKDQCREGTNSLEHRL